MARKVTDIQVGPGLAANVTTGVLVTLASRLGLPVSTTHVSVGSIFGIGAALGNVRWRTASVILLAWVTTLPLAAALAAVSMFALR
jgi:PiT family inorganic phosphate transporter